MDVSAEHPKKAPRPIDVTDSGIVMDVSEEHLKKAHFPIDVTDSGIVMDVSEEHPEKALSPIDVTPFGTTTCFSHFGSHGTERHASVSVRAVNKTTMLNRDEGIFFRSAIARKV